MKKYIVLLVTIFMLFSCGKEDSQNIHQLVQTGNLNNTIFDNGTGSLENVKKIEITQQITPKDIIEKIKSDLGKKYKLLNIADNNKPKEGEVSIEVSSSSTIYKVDGYDFYIGYDGGMSLDIIPHNPNLTDYKYPKANDIMIRKQVVSIYNTFGLSKKETVEGAYNIDVYTGNGIVCTIQTITSQTSTNTASCGEIEKYKEEVKIIKPFADIIKDLTGTTILSNLNINDSLVNGYKKASIGINDINGGGSSILFYKKEPDSWRFFTLTQDPVPCSKYNTMDLKNAFKGDLCYDENSKIDIIVQ